MKLSIITVCLNSEKTISDTINSVNSQNYKNIEHIFIDGGSTDNTINLIKQNPKKNKKIFIKKNTNIYQAMNIGIRKSSGQIIQILNSDDILQSNKKISEVIRVIKKNPNYDIYLGNVAFFSNNNFYKVKRYYVANKEKIKNLKIGDMPPHPGSFVKKKTYKNCGLYNAEYKIASDFEFFYRSIIIKKQKFKFLNNTIVRMRTGGASNKYLRSYLVTSSEVNKAIKKYNENVSTLKIFLRGVLKIKELFLFNLKKINKDFELFSFNFNRDLYNKNSFKILKKVNLLNFKQNFILSGMNLAYLGYYAKKILYPSSNIIHWPDGIFTQQVIDIKKIAGRDLLRKINIPNYIKQITILGNISEKSILYMRKKFKKKIVHIQLPYTNISNLTKKKISLTRNTLTFITLPTPKQEQLAIELSKKNRNFKIICIGGSIAIASGEEREVPGFMQNYEFIWRLKNDFLRRVKRLLESFIFYLKGNYIDNLYNKTIFKIIEKK